MNGSDLKAMAPAQEGIQIDFKRILYRVFQFWYILVICLAVSLGVAIFKMRYVARIYPITASILIKQKDASAEGSLLYNNSLVGGFRNYLDELYIIRSYPLVQETLEYLNFGVSFYQEGNVLTTELYDIPVEARVIDDAGITNIRFHFKKADEHHYSLTQNVGTTDLQKSTASFEFGDTISFEGLKMVFNEKGKNLSTNESYIFAYTRPALLAGYYVGRLRAAWAEEGSGVINLAIEGTHPPKEIDFLNGLITQYQRYDLEKKNLTASRTIDFISGQLNGISDSLHFVEAQLERFKDTNFMTNLSVEAGRLYAKLEPLEAQRVDLILHQSYYQYLTNYLQNNSNYDQAILPSSVGIQDQLLGAQIGGMIDLQLEIKNNLKPENPRVADSKRKLNEIKQDILEMVRNQKSTDKIKDDYLHQQIMVLDKQLKSLPLAERQLISIQRKYTLLENLYIFLLQKRAEAGISKASSTSDISVVNPPMLAGGAIYPKPSKNYFIAVLIGLGLPGLLFVLLEVFNTKIQSKEDVDKVTTIPFIGGVGHKQGHTNLVVLNSPKSSIAESFRALRSNLTYFLGAREKAVFMITSSISGEGKTFTSVNLASVFALSGKKTLIVGADLRRPKIFRDFELNNDVGLSNYLAGLSSFDQIIQTTSNTSLDMISGGSVPPNPSELLLTVKMDDFIAEARRRYDYIIIDTPPLAIVTDAFVLSKYADHTLFLIRQNYTPKSLIRTANDFYISGKLQNISIVLNDIYKTGPGYGYGYGHGYGYGYNYGYGSRKKSKNGYGYYTES